MVDLILKANNTFKLFNKGDTVTVAFSGGADSVALLHALISLKEVLGITVNAAHLNHSIRDVEADRDQQFVIDFCKSLGVEIFCEKLDVPKYADENHLSLELAAREVRYEFLNRVANGKIATAHTASDNLETLIFNLSRGTALKGLCGIPPKRDIIIRPIIFCTRTDVENYCKKHNLNYVTDSTNLCDDYSRNKIRHNVIPVLKEINSGVEFSTVRTALSLSEDNDFLENTSNHALFALLTDNGILTEGITNLHTAIAKRVIKAYFAIYFPEITLENHHINSIYTICVKKGGKVNLPSCIFAEVKNGVLTFFDCEDANTPEFSVVIKKIKNVNNLFSNNMLDCDKIIGELTVRTRLEGDSIRIHNRGCTKTLKKLFCESKIPLNIRECLPVIADEKGVVWVHNIGVASRCAVSKTTKNIFEIEVNDR